MKLAHEKLWLALLGLIVVLSSGAVARVALPTNDLAGLHYVLFHVEPNSEYFYIAQIPIYLSPLFFVAALIRQVGQTNNMICAMYIPLFLAGIYIAAKGLSLIGVVILVGLFLLFRNAVGAKRVHS